MNNKPNVLILALTFVLLGVMSATAQDQGFLVFRIDSVQSQVSRRYGQWKVQSTVLETVEGRFKVHLSESSDPEHFDFLFEDIDTIAHHLSEYEFLPSYPGVLTLMDSGLFWGTHDCDDFTGYILPGKPIDFFGITELCTCCPDAAPYLYFYIIAKPEPILLPKLAQSREPLQALVHWFSQWGRVLATASSVSVHGNQIAIHGDITVAGGAFALTLPECDLYSFPVNLPPLAAGSYQVQYWERTIFDGQPISDTTLQGQVQLLVQGNIPTTGTTGTALLVLALMTAGTVLLRSMTM